MTRWNRMPKKRKKRGMSIRRDALDVLFSLYVRSRAGWKCERCGTQYPSEGSGRQGLHCSHYHKRRKQSVRFDPFNADSLCFGCHQFFEENREAYKLWKLHHIGLVEFHTLEARARQHGKPDRAAIKLWLTQELKRLEAA